MAKDNKKVDTAPEGISEPEVAAPAAEAQKKAEKPSKGTKKVKSAVIKDNEVSIGAFVIKFNSNGEALITDAEWAALQPFAEAYRVTEL